MKNIKQLAIGLALTTVITACDPSDFGDINISPNSPSSPISSLLLTGAERRITGIFTDTQGSLYTQQIANKQYTSADRYETQRFSYNGYYAGPLINLEQIIEINTNEATKGDAAQFGSNNNQIAVAKILQSYIYMHLTDRWGDVPYTQALKGSENFQPAFDMQQDIYPAIIKTLTQASAQIDNGPGVKGDFINGGDMDKWKKFANSLRAIMALRMSEVNPTLGKTEFAAAIAAGVITSNDQNIVYPFLSEDANDNPWEDRFETRRDWTVTEKMVDMLKSYNDPRLPVYADIALLKQDYVGMVYGLDESQAGSISNGNVSFLGKELRQQTSPGYILTTAQVEFARAEAALLGWTSENAEEHYNKGVTAALGQYGVGAKASEYLKQANVKFNAANAKEQIGNQRWIALFLNGYESWSEWRRTGFPKLQAPANNLNPGGGIPRRQAYTTTERDLNGANYTEAVSRMGGTDDLNGRVWWDKK